MDPSFIEHQYTSSFWPKKKEQTRDERLNEFLQICTRASKDAREKFVCELNTPYGDSEREVYDTYNPNGDVVVVYIHGGYFYEGDKNMYGYVAQAFASQNITTVVVGYDLCPKVTVADIQKQITTALKSLVAVHKGKRLIVIGHSAGAYLVLGTSREVNIDHVVLMSGVYDLTSLIHHSDNESICLKPDQLQQLNLMQCDVMDFRLTEVCIFVGKHESPEFQRQSKDLEKKLKGHVQVTSRLLDEDHFSIVENFANKDSGIAQCILEAFM